MDGGNCKNVNEETPYDDISKADPDASLNEVIVENHVPVDDNIFKMDAVRAELPLNLDKSKHVDQGKSTTKRVKKSRKVKDYPEIIRLNDGSYLLYDPRSNVRTMLRERYKAARRKQIEALKQQNHSSEPAALPSSPSAFADA
ncbi:hypothetical protein MKX03_001187 [Papaver bracteatum]|nr:hypothetical protein MKX03_001187 [Papaver bracteatum]